MTFSTDLLRNGGSPSIILKERGVLSGSNLSTVIVEGNVEIMGGSSIDYLTGSGTLTSSNSCSVTIKTIQVDEGNELKTTNSFFIKNLQEIKGGGTLRLESVRNNETLCDWKALDEILRKGGFTGVFGYTSGTYFTNIDFSQIKENTFDYTLMPYFREGSTSSTIITIKMRLEQYVNCKIKWPTEKNRLHRIILELIESGSFKGNATVPAFPKELRSFTLLSSDDSEINPEINCEVVYGTVTNTLSWTPTSSAMAGFTGLPDAVNQTLIEKLPVGKTPGKVMGKTPEEATKALEFFSGIYAFVDQENSDTVDLNVDYAFGISRLTFVDGGKNILVEVTLSSNASASPKFLGKPTLSINGNPANVTPLTDEEISERGLTAQDGKDTRWFLIPYDSLPASGDLSITVSANPPQAN